MKLQLKIGFYMLRTVANVVWKIKIVKIFNQQIFHTNNNSQWRSEFSKLAYRYCDGLYCKCENMYYAYYSNTSNSVEWFSHEEYTYIPVSYHSYILLNTVSANFLNIN
jgi:hypothetical protein